MIIFELNKKDLKLLEDLNQVCKHIVNNYVLVNNCKIFSRNESFKPTIGGWHYAEIPIEYFDKSEFFKNSIINNIEFDSVEIFKSFKTLKKKEIINISLDNNSFYLNNVNDQKFLIGKQYDGKYETDITIVDRFMKTEYIYAFNLESVMDLVENRLVIIKYDKFTLRMTRELTPNLKSDDQITIYFKERESSMITISIKVVKAETNIITYHIYNAVNF